MAAARPATQAYLCALLGRPHTDPGVREPVQQILEQLEHAPESDERAMDTLRSTLGDTIRTAQGRTMVRRARAHRRTTQNSTPPCLHSCSATATIHRSPARGLRAGSVWVNYWDGGDMTAPFGGFKQSGNGRDKSLHAFDKYTEIKATWINLAD